MNDVRLETERNGYRLIVASDMEPDDPRGKYNLGIMLFWNDKSYLGDDHEFKGKNGELKFQQSQLWRETEIVLNLFVDDSDGIKISTKPIKDKSEMADGKIIATYARIVYWFGEFSHDTMDMACNELIREINEYNDYLNDNMVRYSVITPEGRVIDSVGGFSVDAPIKDTIKAMGEVSNKRNRFLFDAMLREMESDSVAEM